MSKILSILSIFLIFNLGYSKALLVDSQHAIFSSLNIFVDTENVIDEQTDDYDRKISSLSEFNFSYVYNRTFEINLSYKNNPSIENGFMIPFEGAVSSFGITYYVKNIFKKLGIPVKGENLPVSGILLVEDDEKTPIIMPFDFNLNFNIKYNEAIDYNYSSNGYGLGLSWEMSEQSLIKNYTIYPFINYMFYEYKTLEKSVSYDMLTLELLTNITVPPKDNQEVKAGFFLTPSVTAVDLKDAFFGISVGIYYKI